MAVSETATCANAVQVPCWIPACTITKKINQLHGSEHIAHSYAFTRSYPSVCQRRKQDTPLDKTFLHLACEKTACRRCGCSATCCGVNRLHWTGLQSIIPASRPPLRVVWSDARACRICMLTYIQGVKTEKTAMGEAEEEKARDDEGNELANKKTEKAGE